MASEKTSLRDQLTPGKYRALDDELSAGTLEARLSEKGVMFYWRLDVRPKTYRYKIGSWDASAPPLKAVATAKGYGRLAAKTAAQAMAEIHLGSDWGPRGGYPAYVDDQAAQHEQAQETAIAQKRAKAIEEQALKARQSFTVELLIAKYCDHQESLGKQSAYDARNLLVNHIVQANPKLAAMAACDVDSEQVADAIRAINEQGKGRTANKVRSYLRAAFGMAAKAKTNPSIPLVFKAFKIKHNPVMDVSVIAGGNKTAKAPLLADGLTAYWRSIESLGGVEGHVLRLHILTGGQRVAQLCRLKRSDVQSDEIRLLDPKGKRQQARDHRVPLTVAAKIEVQALLNIQTKGEHLISTDGGLTEAWSSTVNQYAKKAAGVDGFTIKRIRSGVETLLASKGVSREIRAQLQSHGLSGVQQASYDGHDYKAEKLFALETLYSALTQVAQPKVVNLR
jgi:integrase